MVRLKKVVIPVTDEVVDFFEKIARRDGKISATEHATGVCYSSTDGTIKALGLDCVSLRSNDDDNRV